MFSTSLVWETLEQGRRGRSAKNWSSCVNWYGYRGAGEFIKYVGSLIGRCETKFIKNTLCRFSVKIRFRWRWKISPRFPSHWIQILSYGHVWVRTTQQITQHTVQLILHAKQKTLHCTFRITTIQPEHFTVASGINATPIWDCAQVQVNKSDQKSASGCTAKGDPIVLQCSDWVAPNLDFSLISPFKPAVFVIDY